MNLCTKCTNLRFTLPNLTFTPPNLKFKALPVQPLSAAPGQAYKSGNGKNRPRRKVRHANRDKGLSSVSVCGRQPPDKDWDNRFVRFISFDDLRADAHVLDGVDVLINVGDGDTAHTGGREWEDPAVAATVRGFVYNGGGLIGVGEPAGHQYEGHYLQLAGVLGVEKETGFTLGYDKYNWDEHPGHFILEDCTKPVDFGEGKKGIYALPDTEILVQREKEVQMAVHAFGKGRAVYISGLPYSFENSRVLYRSILWSAHDEESLHKWFSSNFNVEVHAYVKNGKYCVVNNTYEPQSTVVYKGDGSSFALDMAANEIKWYEI